MNYSQKVWKIFSFAQYIYGIWVFMELVFFLKWNNQESPGNSPIEELFTLCWPVGIHVR